jgi:hypothetical protein
MNMIGMTTATSVAFALFAFSQGLFLSEERHKPFAALTGLSMTLASLASLILTPREVMPQLYRLASWLNFSGLPELDPLLLLGFLFIVFRLWVFFFRTEDEREEENIVAQIVSLANRACIRLMLIGAVAHAGVKFWNGTLLLI